MKREYSRPYLAVESFQLNAAIAGACSGDNVLAISQSVALCTMQDDKGEQYPSVPYYGAACQVDVPAGEAAAEGICYQNFAITDSFLES